MNIQLCIALFFLTTIYGAPGTKTTKTSSPHPRLSSKSVNQKTKVRTEWNTKVMPSRNLSLKGKPNSSPSHKKSSNKIGGENPTASSKKIKSSTVGQSTSNHIASSSKVQTRLNPKKVKITVDKKSKTKEVGTKTKRNRRGRNKNKKRRVAKTPEEEKPVEESLLASAKNQTVTIVKVGAKTAALGLVVKTITDTVNGTYSKVKGKVVDLYDKYINPKDKEGSGGTELKQIHSSNITDIKDSHLAPEKNKHVNL